jgi:small nuclear ribonucleoprotein (snRNP)-like protein
MSETESSMAQESLAKEYIGENVRVYLTSGTILSGKLEKVCGYEALIHDTHRNKQSFVNLAHVISILKL